MDETPVVSPTPETKPEPKTSWPALIGLVIAALLIAGGAYYLKETLPGYPQMQAVTPETLEEQSDSTEPEAIEEDLAAQDPDSFDQELDTAFAELDASLAE